MDGIPAQIEHLNQPCKRTSGNVRVRSVASRLNANGDADRPELMKTNKHLACAKVRGLRRTKLVQLTSQFETARIDDAKSRDLFEIARLPQWQLVDTIGLFAIQLNSVKCRC